MTPVGAAPARAWRRRGRGLEDGGTAGLGALGLSSAMVELLRARGVGTDAAARAYLRPRIEHLRDPFDLADMRAAVERLSAAVRGGERILVHGDYDVDGMCGAALFTRVLRRLGADVVPFVPHRTRDGYDLGPAGVDRAHEVGARVLLTVDCGTSALEATATAAAKGIDVVVTDHHAVGGATPDCIAFVNPSRPDCRYGEPLCGAGVAFKVCEALVGAGEGREDLLWELDLVALATIADLVPLTGENRVLARYGMRALANTRNTGLAALLDESGSNRAALRVRDLSHVLAPRLNAVGRLEDAATGLALLLGDDPREAVALAAHLGEVNRRRQDLDRAMLEEALEMLPDEPGAARTVVVAGAGWHPGVIGIVASRLVERLHRPTFVLALPEAPDAPARGSGRSIPGFDLVGALADTAPHLVRYGGHAMAAGLDIEPAEIPAFRAAFEVAAERRMEDALLVPTFAYDGALDLAALLDDVAPLQRHMEPFGVGNPTPTFLCPRLRVVTPPRPVGRGHLRLRLAAGDATIDAVGFHFAEAWPDLAEGDVVDALVQVRDDVWRGRSRRQLKLVDMRPAAAAAVAPAVSGSVSRAAPPGPGGLAAAGEAASPAAGPRGA
ncbi:MAG TPA: single-stranded-DNA-specific exonuclease RecJ [Longimicrobiales bacterium]|nr:single-stranded-DNA-specific exonuclease RecJ [Longimicrobiales bacterium]